MIRRVASVVCPCSASASYSLCLAVSEAVENHEHDVIVGGVR